MKLTLTSLLFLIISSSFCQSLLKFSEKGKFGYMNSNREIKIQPTFSHAQEFSEGLAFVHIDKRIGLINEVGKLIVKPIFDHAYPFTNGVAIVCLDSLYGLIDVKGKFIIEAEFQRLHFQSEGIVAVKKNNLWGFYSTQTGKPITEIIYARVGTFSQGLALVQDNLTGKYGFINVTGQLIIPCTLNQVYSDFNNGYAAVSDSSRGNCFIDSAGVNVFDEYYYSVSRFSEGFAFVKKDSYESGYFIDNLGKRTSEDTFKTIWNFSEGFCGVETDSSYAVINSKHQIVFESKSIELRFFKNGFGFYCNRSDDLLTWGLMDTTMNIISELDFVKVFSIPNMNFVEFYYGDPSKWYGYSKRGYIDIEGNILWQEE